jgi:hypothetical protein
MTKDRKLRRDFTLTKFEMVAYSPEELIAAYTPESEEDSERPQSDVVAEVKTLKTLVASISKPKVKNTQSTYDPDIDSRHIRCFEISRHECYALFHTKKWSREAVLQICKDNAETLNKSQYGAIARAIFEWIEENFRQNEGFMTNRSGWADLRWHYFRRDVGETLVDFAQRLHMSYAMAKKYSRKKKLYRHTDGRLYFKANTVLENAGVGQQHINNTTKEREPLSYIHGYRENASNSVDDDLRREFAEVSCMELERPPPRPIPKVLTTLTGTQSAKLWDDL